MVFKMEIGEQKVQPVLSIKAKTSVEKLPSVIGESYRKIFAYMTELGEQPVDAPFTAYYNLDMQNLDVEMGFPVSKPLPGKDEIKVGEIPSGKIASCMYKGPYSKMEEPYNEMFQWLAANGHEQVGVYYEYYYNAPGEVPENELLTRIVIPVK